MIIADSNEPKSFIRELRSAGIQVITENLDMGDYVIGKFLIERKEAKDFMASIQDRRLWDQQWAMLHNEENHIPLLLVHGDLPPKFKWKRHGKRVYKERLSKDEYRARQRSAIGAICSSLSSYEGVNLVALRDEDQAILFLINLYYNLTSKKKSRKPVKKLPATTYRDYKWNLLVQLPRVGSAGADMIIDAGVSINELSNMSVNEMKNRFRGIGEKTATNILNILNN